MEKKITELLNPGLTFNLMLSEDGSGKGAALVAAVATKQTDRRRKISMEQMGKYVPPRETVNRKHSRMELEEFVTQINKMNNGFLSP